MLLNVIFFYLFIYFFLNTTFYKSHVLHRSSWYRELKKKEINSFPTLSIILSTTILVVRKKQTRRITNKLIRNKTELLGQKKTASKKIIIAIGCCFMTDVSIYTHKTTPSF